jgi:hypothetical protein
VSEVRVVQLEMETGDYGSIDYVVKVAMAPRGVRIAAPELDGGHMHPAARAHLAQWAGDLQRSDIAPEIAKLRGISEQLESETLCHQLLGIIEDLEAKS